MSRPRPAMLLLASILIGAMLAADAFASAPEPPVPARDQATDRARPAATMPVPASLPAQPAQKAVPSPETVTASPAVSLQVQPAHKDAQVPSSAASPPKIVPIRGASSPKKAASETADGSNAAIAAAGTSDLVATVLSTSTNPLIAVQPYQARWEVENHGTQAETFYTTYYVANQAVYTWYVQGLPVAYLVWGTLDTSQLVAGTFEVKVVADTTNMVAETNESNNTVAHSWTWQGTKDMAAASLSTSTNPLVAGQPYHLEWRIDNSGGLNIPESFSTYYYVANRFCSSWLIDGLQAGDHIDGSADIIQPVAGTFEVRIVADAAGTVAESNENNNTVANTLSWQGTPDMVATNLSTTTSPLVAGQPYHVRWDVLNQGTATALGNVKSYYYVANQWLSWSYATDLGPGWGYYVEGDLTWPTAGTFEAKMVVDPEGLIAESNEGNNTLAHNWSWQQMPMFTASSGDQPFYHATDYFTRQGASPFIFAAHTNAQTTWGNSGNQKSVSTHYMGTMVTNGRSYPFPIDVYGPHIYYSTPQRYFDLTSTYFSQAGVICAPQDVCEGFNSSQSFLMDNAPVIADSEIWINTGSSTGPSSHHEEMSNYSF